MPRLFSSLMPPLIQDQFVVVAACRSSLFLFILHFLVRFGRSSCSSFFRVLVLLRRRSRASVVVPPPAFAFFFSLLSGLSLYLVIDAYYAPLPRTPSYCPLSLRHYLNIHSLHAITSPASSFWSGFTSLLICLLLITFYVSYPDALLDLYDFAFEPLTSW